MRSLRRFLTGLFLITTFISILFSKRGLVLGDPPSGPPASGDWVITGTESCQDQVIVLNGNLVIQNGGDLTLSNVELKMNCIYDGQYNITVESGGRFHVFDGSMIASADPARRIGFFLVQEDSTFRMNNSELHNLGSDYGLGPGGLGPSGLIIFSSDAIVENSLISHNKEGINIFSDDVVVRDNIIAANDRKGIAVHYCSPIIRNNTIVSNLGMGIGIHWAESSPTIQDNIITLNKDAGIVADTGCSPLIQGNNITSNWIGIALHNQATGIIQGNVIMRNYNDGILSHKDSNPLIRGNMIAANEQVGIRCLNNSLPEIHWNDIHGNKESGVANYDPSVTVNATNNYWRDGPSTSSNVLSDPWLTESILSAGITSPLSSETVSSAVTVSTTVDALNTVHKVEFYVDDQMQYTDYDAPYDWKWNTTQYTDAEHELTAKVYDMLGLKILTSVKVFVDNTPPTVSIKEHSPESKWWSGVARIGVAATDNKELENVRVSVDENEWLAMTYDPATLLWEYDLNTTSLSDGHHALRVLAVDKAGNQATTETALLTDNSPPNLAILTLEGGTSVGLTLNVDVQASDASGITKVEFHLQDVLVSVVTETPYRWSWDTTEYPNGEYTITVKAYDTMGNMKTSQTGVTVRNVESPWWQTHFLTIIEVLTAIGGLILGIITLKKRRQ